MTRSGGKDVGSTDAPKIVTPLCSDIAGSISGRGWRVAGHAELGKSLWTRVTSRLNAGIRAKRAIAHDAATNWRRETGRRCAGIVSFLLFKRLGSSESTGDMPTESTHRGRGSIAALLLASIIRFAPRLDYSVFNGLFS